MKVDPNIYRQTFFDEAQEHLSSLEASLLRLEAGIQAHEVIESAFRAAHSVKGGADAVGFPEITRFTHEMESLLDQMRGEHIITNPELNLLFESTDTLSNLIACAKEEKPCHEDVDDLIHRLRAENNSISLPRPVVVEKETIKNIDVAASQSNRLTVKVTPHPDALRNGLDPIPLLRELTQAAAVSRIDLDASALPPLEIMEPETSYMSWDVHLITDQTADQILELFAFAPDMIQVTINPMDVSIGLTADKPETEVKKTFHTDGFGFQSAQYVAYLVQQKHITSAQAIHALDQQRQKRPLIGQVALRLALLTESELLTILSQKTAGERFGETAVRLDILNKDELGQLVQTQDAETPSIGQVLVASGYIDEVTQQKEFQSFQANTEVSCSEKSTTNATAEADSLTLEATVLSGNRGMYHDFCSEADEHLETADKYLLILDSNPSDHEALNAVYRAFHTIKGVSSMLELNTVKMIAHEAENLLNLAREGKVVLQNKPMDLVFSSTDALKRQVLFIRNWSATEGPLPEDSSLPALLLELRTLVKRYRVETGVVSVTVQEEVDTHANVSLQQMENNEFIQSKSDTAIESLGTNRRGSDKETVRVDKDRLDKLINTIGELVISQSMAQREFDELSKDSGVLSQALPELSKISLDLQELSLSLRMVPLQNTFQKMARLVRDLSRKMGKPVSLSLHGEETELDKTVVDQLGDPLMHMVRNAVDHGLEDSQSRVAAGKPAEGQLNLKAYHQGGHVYIELTDDGKGLDRERIIRKAIEKGLVQEGQRLTDTEAHALIFAPGFSTAKEVTDVSGRGVGMDVVRRNVEALQGTIFINTELGKGTTFTIRLPLTLAIMDGLLVGLGDDVYVLPLMSVIESFQPKPSDVHKVACHGEAITIRGEVVPLLRLHRVLDRPSKHSEPCQALAVLVEDHGKKYALLIDDLLGQMQAVVKSLDVNYQRVDGLAGATILGDGRVAMILDIHGLIQLHSQVTGEIPAPFISDHHVRLIEENA